MLQQFTTFQVGDHNYRCRRMDAKTQFHVIRRVLPLLSKFMSSNTSIMDSPNANNAAEIIMGSLNKIASNDYDFIINNCLLSVEREEAPGSYQRIMTPDGHFMYEEINYDLVSMMKIVFEVLKFNFSDFFTALPSVLPEVQ